MMNNAGTIVFVSFENEYAPVGGLAAVMKLLPPEVSRWCDTILITPCFQNIERTKRAIREGEIVGTCMAGRVFHNGQFHEIQLLKALPRKDRPAYAMYLVKADKYFLAGENPYIDTWRFDALFSDAHFLCKSVPAVLGLLSATARPPYKVSLHDWETALAVESMKLGPLTQCYLTLHNVYDTDLRGDPRGQTVLQHCIPLMQGLSAVSEQYAIELTTDVLQRDCLAEKLQPLLSSKPILGINNGNFVPLHFPVDARSVEDILAFKRAARLEFTGLLRTRADMAPRWGHRIDLAADDKPIFLVFGRDDPKQKGFEVAAAAAYRFLHRSGKGAGYFVFAPIPGPHGLDGIAYLEGLCREFPDNAMVFPFRLAAGYQELQRAASYIIMPSYYEPFGAANEGYASGVPVIARATGGLIQQVCPVETGNLTERVLAFCRRYHGDALDKPTGFLYREHPSTETAENWKYLLGTKFGERRPIQEPVDKLNPVFWSMVEELSRVLGKAISYYANKPQYCRLITNGISLFNKFSWEASAKDYLEKLFGMSSQASAQT
ncbi:MAG: glycogen/starch synthase [Candidatus Lokiarchaeota archaeon]|nr:glycogen/starch synthase [Candidatus Lokiarchaeota archaeon]